MEKKITGIYRILIEWDETKACYVTTVPELQNRTFWGKTRDQAYELATDEISRQTDGLDKRDPVSAPIAISDKTFSGRILVRVSPHLHKELRLRANEEGISVNQFIAKTLKDNLR